MAIQHGRPIFSLSASFQLEQGGVDHQVTMPDVPGPDELPSMQDRFETAGRVDVLDRFPRPFDLRYVDDPPWAQRAKGPRQFSPHQPPSARQQLPHPVDARVHSFSWAIVLMPFS